MIRKNKFNVNCLVSVILMLFFFQISICQGHASDKHSIVLADQSVETSIIRDMAKYFMDKVEKDSNGRITFKRRLGGTLGDYMTLAEQTSKGSIDMCMVWPPSDLHDKIDLGWLGWMVKDIEEARSLFGPKGPMFEIFEDIYSDVNMKLLMIGSDGMSGIHIRKGTGLTEELNQFPDDADGIKARIPSSKLFEARARALGFSPVAVPYSEVYTGLQLGSFDARFTTEPSELVAFGDVLEGWIGINDICEPFYLLMNRDSWNEISSKDQKIIQEAADEMAIRNWDQLPEYTKEWEEKGKEKYDLNIRHLSDEKLKAIHELGRKEEWPVAEELFGKDLMKRVNEAREEAGLD